MAVRTRALSVIVFTGVGLVVLAQTWLDHGAVEGQFAIAYFEESAGQTRLVVDRERGNTLPQSGIGDRNVLTVMPGAVVSVPLGDGAEYGITNENASLVPYVVISSTDPSILTEPIAFAISNGELRTISWNPSLPWADDRSRLAAIGQSCGGTRLTRVRAEHAVVTLNVGRCSVSVPKSERAQLAVIAGPDWVEVSRAGGWQRHTRVRFGGLLVCLIVASVGAWMLSEISTTACLAAALVLAGLSLWGRAWGIAGLLLLDCGAWTLWLRRRLAKRFRLRRAAFHAAWLFGSVLPIAILLVVGGLAITAEEHPNVVPPNTQCLVMGYSAARGSALGAPDREVLSAQLGANCGPCMGRASVDAQSGQTLSWVREQACQLPKEAPLREVIFFGGANDDLLWGSNHGAISRAISLFSILLAPVEARSWMARANRAMAASRTRLDRQSDAIRGAAACLRERGSRFWFAHDFLAWDLETGRSNDRAAMAQGRRAAVEQAGGTFVDLYAEFKATASVSWFSDFIHPSQIGHRRIAELICTRLQTAK
jgi:hypothetical protein